MNNPKVKYTSLKKLSKDDRPREKLIEKGRGALSNAEIVGILLGSGSRSKSAVELGREILNSVNNNLDRLARLTVHDLMKFRGVGTAKAVSLMAALELGRRKENTKRNNHSTISGSRDIYLHVKEKFQDLEHEEFYLMMLNQANRVLAVELISKGGINGTVVDPKIIFKKVFEQCASAIVLCHNHPSGNLFPSNADIQITKKIENFARLVDVRLIDHLIITDESYYSFFDSDKIENQLTLKVIS